MADDTFTQADIDKAVKEAVAASEEGLKAKLQEVMDEAKEAKRKLRAASEIKPEDVAALETEIDELRGKLTAAEKTAKDATKAAETAQKALEAESGFTKKLLIQDGLKSALLANGVKDEDFIDSLTAKFAGSASVAIDGDTRKAMIGDKPLPDAIKEWAGTDAGKKFVEAPHNSGGGAPGGKGGEGGKTMSKADHQKLSTSDPKAANQFVREGGKIVDEAA